MKKTLLEVGEYWHQVVKINDYQKERFAQKIIDHYGGDLTGRTIAILGWAFKANTNDSRESAAIYVSEKLYKAGAILEIYDPMVLNIDIENDIKIKWNDINLKIGKRISITNRAPSFQDIDATVILTEWEEFKSLDFNKSKIFDGRNILIKSFYSIGK